MRALSDTARKISFAETGSAKNNVMGAPGLTAFAPSSGSLPVSAGRAVEKEKAKGASSVLPSSARVPEGTSTWWVVALEKRFSGSNLSVLEPIHRHCPGTSGVMTTGGLGSSGAVPRRRMLLLKTIVTFVAVLASPEGAAKTTASGPSTRGAGESGFAGPSSAWTGAGGGLSRAPGKHAAEAAKRQRSAA